MVLFSFYFFFSFSSFHCNFFFFFVTVGFLFFLLFFFYKTLALKDSNTVQTTATNPHPWGPSRVGGSGGPPGFLCGCFPGVWHRWAGAGFWGGGICTALPWGDGHKKGNLNKKTTKSRGPTKTGTTLGKGPGAQ